MWLQSTKAVMLQLLRIVFPLVFCGCLVLLLLGRAQAVT